MALAAELEQTTEEQPIPTETQPEASPPADSAPKEDAKPPELELDKDSLETLREAQAELARERELRQKAEQNVARMKGIAGKQAREITRTKEGRFVSSTEEDEDAEPARQSRTQSRRAEAEHPFGEPDEDGYVLYHGMKVSEEWAKRDAARDGVANELAELRAEREAERQAAQDAREKQATEAAETAVCDTAIRTGLTNLGIADDKEISDFAGFVLDQAFRATAAEQGLAIDGMNGKQITAVLKEILPEVDRLLGYRPKAQQRGNEQYRSKFPTKPGGAPGVTTGKKWSEMTEAEKIAYSADVSRRHLTEG